MSARTDRANATNAMIASFLGWTMDAFDFFVLTLVLTDVARDFHTDKAAVALTLTASLVMRPVGALLFGVIADRFGRRLPLMIDVVFYAIVEVFSGLAPSYKVFFGLRLLYGIGMGGEWGVGASLALESVPAKWRGLLSGLLQEGYAFGYLLAAIAYPVVYHFAPHLRWRALFFLGGAPALLALFVRSRVKESAVWEKSRAPWSTYGRTVVRNWRRFLYLVALMAMLNLMSHGTQDMFPTLLKTQRHLTQSQVSFVTVISMVGAILGGLVVGGLSNRWGRRRTMVAAALLGVLVVPAWAFSPRLAVIVAGAFALQFMVQGAWGVIPAHLNELSPGALRGFFPGFAYQLGVLIAAGIPAVEAVLARHISYSTAMGTLAVAILLVGSVVIALGPEARGVSFDAPVPAAETADLVADPHRANG